VAGNEAEHQRWNDEYWTSAWPQRERLTSVVTEYLVERLAPRPGERILDVGSGGGTATLALAGRVGTGSVVGADISHALTDLARERARARGATNVSFVVADAQDDALPGDPFDAVASQFGVMFFEDPVRAFANLRAHVVAGGRLGFACWRATERNPWFLGAVLAPYVEAPPPPAPGASPTGPFALSDPERTASLLTSAGWSTVTWEGCDAEAEVDVEVLTDDDYLRYMGVAEGDLDSARGAVDGHLAPLRRDNGRLVVPLSFFIFSAFNTPDTGSRAD